MMYIDNCKGQQLEAWNPYQLMAMSLQFHLRIISFQNPRLHHSQFLIPKRPLSSSSGISYRIRSRSSRSGNGSSNMAPLPETDCPVPADQQPIIEYQNLSTSFPFSWALGDIVEYCSRLLVTGSSFTLLIALPVAWFGAVGTDSDPLMKIVGAVSSGILFVTLAVVRMYLGWAYVGNRLLSATVEYEETGWYDGQIWVKTAQVLARDRLLGSFQVKPVLSRLKYTLVSLGASLVVCALLLINPEGSQKAFYSTAPESGGRSIPGVYNDDSARSFEPDAFCGEPGLP